jgi:hypothetical protein
MPYHAKHRIDPGVDHRFHHQVGNGGFVGRFGGHAHIHPIGTDIDRKGLRMVVVKAGSLPRLRVIIPAVPGAAKQSVFDGTFAQWPTLMGAAVIEARKFTLEMGQTNSRVVGRYGGNAAFGQVIG